VKIAKQRIQEAANNQATTPLASQVNGQLEQEEEGAASTLAS
jgi:hypothetical protein